MMLAVFAPVFHVYEAAAPAVSVADCPEQILGEFTAILPPAPITTVPIAVAVQDPLAPVTVYELVVVGLTAMDAVVAPVLHV